MLAQSIRREVEVRDDREVEHIKRQITRLGAGTVTYSTANAGLLTITAFDEASLKRLDAGLAMLGIHASRSRTPQPSKPAQHRIANLDMMRGLAAIAVMIYHVGQHTPSRHWLSDSGYLAVDFFFMMSGYVMALAYDRRMPGLTFKSFVEARIIRLYPLHLAGIVIAAAVPVAEILLHRHWAPVPSRFAMTVLSHALLVPDPNSPGLLYPLNGPAWSLACEMVVSLAYAALLWRLRSRQLMIVTILGAPLIAYGCWTYGSLDIGANHRTWIFGMARALTSFCIGMVIHRAMPRSRRRSPWSFLAWLVLAALLFTPAWRGATWAIDLFVAFTVFPALLLVAVSCEPPAWLDRISALSGDLSYPLYVTHYPLLVIFFARASFTPVNAGIIMLFACLVAMVIARWYDAPVRRTLSRRARLREMARPVTPA